MGVATEKDNNSAGFKVIVVGGGPVGLTAALALSRAGIDFVVLEGRESAVSDVGSNLVLFPHGLRALSQLGVLDAMVDSGASLSETSRQDHSGLDLGSVYYFGNFHKYFGIAPQVLSRHDITRILYEALPAEAQAKIHARKAVVDVSLSDDDARVTCKDGTSYSGSVVIGADGAHSAVRRNINRLAVEAGSASEHDKPSFVTTFRCLWVRFPTSAGPGLKPGHASETHGPGVSTQLFSGHGTTVAGIYERLDTPTAERARYTHSDQEALIEKWGSLPILPNKVMTMKQAWDVRFQSGLVNLEEGVAKHWSWGGRMVLVGDAAHKFTPSTGAGCNQGIIDVVALANHLHDSLQEARCGIPEMSPLSVPAPTQLDAAFKTYYKNRYWMAAVHCHTSGHMTTMSTWPSWLLQLLDRWVMPIDMVQSFIISAVSILEARMPVFGYVTGEDRFRGTIRWANPLPSSVSI